MVDQLTAQEQTQLDGLANGFLQWNIGSNQKGSVLSKAHFDQYKGEANDHLYSLKGTTQNKFLQYEEQTWGINLGWTNDASAQTEARVSRWFFTRQNGTGKAVTYGETIALAYGTGRSFLQYEGRPLGINLDWSNPPVFEWQIFGGQGTRGQPVQCNQRVAIRNTKVDEFFVHFNRNLGGDIGWGDSERWGTQFSAWITPILSKIGEEAVKKAVIAALS